MMYTGAIIGYLSWPFMILVSYLAVRWALRYFDRRRGSETSAEESMEASMEASTEASTGE